MAQEGDTQLNARILYWGPSGSGKTTNLHRIRQKLRQDHRGDLRSIATRIDPSVSYEVLPIELGQVGGLQTRIEIVAVPGGAEQAPTRKQLLDRVDGVVIVLDAEKDRIDENLASFEELQGMLAAYGRSLAGLPCVVQYNKSDIADPFTMEELHRKLELPEVAVFEAVATEGTGVLPTLTTVSKRVVRALRDARSTPDPADTLSESASPATERAGTAAPSEGIIEANDPVAEPIESPVGSEEPAEPVLEAVVEDAEPVTAEFVAPGRIEVESVGEPVEVGHNGLRLPIVLQDATGARHRLTVTLEIDPADGDR